MLEELKEQVCRANLQLCRYGLVVLTWGNVSALSKDGNYVVIKPSGVPYDDMKPENMVVVDLEGNIVEGSLRPSSDLPTHLELYRSFKGIGGITHTHSRWATAFAQAERDLPCYGTTHADTFYGPAKAGENARTLAETAHMAAIPEQLAPGTEPAPQTLLDKHFLRKHGAGAYYGQKKA